MRFRCVNAALAVAGVVLLATLSAHGAGMVVSDMTSNSATDLATSIVGGMSGVTLVPNSATYTGANRAAGAFSGASGILAFSDGVVLTTGSVANIPGPNNTTAVTYSNNTAGDTSLNT